MSNADKGAVGLIPALELASLTGVRFLTEYVFRPFGGTTSLEEYESPEDPFLFVMELLWG